MECKNCGHELEEKVRYCTTCGEEVAKYGELKKGKNKVHIPIIIIGALAILSIATISVMAMQNKKQPKQNVIFGDGTLKTLKAEELVIPPDGEIKTISEEWIYYQQGNVLWKIKVDGSNQSKVLDMDTTITWQYLDGVEGKTGYIYYLYEGNIFRINLEDETKEKISDKLFKTIQYVVDQQLDEEYLIFTNYDNSHTLLIDAEGTQNSFDLNIGIKSIKKNGDYLVYNTEETIYKYDMTTSQEKEIVPYQTYFGQDNSMEIYLIGIKNDHIYYGTEEKIEGLSFGQRIYKVNMDTLEEGLFYTVYSSLDSYGGIYISGEYLYAIYYPMRHDFVVEQISLKDGQLKSTGAVLGEDEQWVYKIDNDKIFKFNVKTEQEAEIRSVHPIYWYQDYKVRSASKIGEWIYFNDYKTPPTGDDYSNPGDLVFDNFRVNIKTGKEEELTGGLDQFINLWTLKDKDGTIYALEENEISRFKNDIKDPIIKIGHRPEKAIIACVYKEQKASLMLPTETIQLELGTTQALEYKATPEDVELYCSSSNNYVASISKDGILTAHNPGTTLISLTAIKEGYRRDSRTIQVEVKGDKMLSTILSSRVIIIFPEQEANIFFDKLVGSEIKATNSDDSIADIELSESFLTITGKEAGLTNISLTAKKEGYPPSTYLTSVVVMNPLELNIPEIVYGATSHWSAIPETERNTPMIQNGIMKEGEGIIRAISTETITIKKEDVILTESMLQQALKKAEAAKLQLQAQLYEHKIIPSKELETSLNISVISKDKGLTENVVLEKKIINYFKEDIKHIDINIEKLGVSVGVDLSYLDEIFSNHEKIRVLIEKIEDAYQIRFYDTKDNEIAQLDEGLRVFIKTNSEDGLDVFNQGIYKKSLGSKRQIPVTYDGIRQGLSFKTRESGLYVIGSTNSMYTDLDNLDEETKKSIESLSKQSIVSDESTLFRANDLITRAEFAQMMVNTFYALDYLATSKFTDVTQSDIYYAHIASSEQEGIVKGFPDGTFKGNDIITKEQVISIAARSLVIQKGYLRPVDIESYLIYYKDKEAISEWAKGEVAFAVKENIIDVPTDGLLGPKEGITRGESAVLINRLFGRLY